MKKIPITHSFYDNKIKSNHLKISMISMKKWYMYRFHFIYTREHFLKQKKITDVESTKISSNGNIVFV
jgi:hypothetical protein